MLKTIAQFIISGTIVILATYLSPRVGQKWAGLLVAAPLLTLLTFVFLSMGNPTLNLKGYLLSALLYMIPAALCILSMLLLSQRVHFVLNILISLTVYSLFVALVFRLKTS